MSANLQTILTRARAAAAAAESHARQKALKRSLKDKWKRKQAEQAAVAADYARRLAERAKFRALLSQEAQDGLRFRWYFEHIENTVPLDQLRRWIDAKMAKEEKKSA